MTSLFSKKIFCHHCNGGMRIKTERGKRKYICSRHSNDSKVCSRESLIEESFLTCLIYKRYGELSDTEMRNIVDKIVVKKPLLFEITFTNGDESILFSENHIRY